MRLKPTLWRTCRALANRPRLRLLYAVWRQPNQTVSDLAHRLRMPLPTASLYLRHLNARGLIQARRTSKWVSYRVAADPHHPDADELVRALTTAFSAGIKSLDELYRLATAFTHPRRVEIVRALRTDSLPAHAIRVRTGISRDALSRHLRKLQARRFLTERNDHWRCTCPSTPMAATLLRLACRRHV